MVGQLHELVDEVRFIDVTGNGTQLFVGGETLPGRGERIRESKGVQPNKWYVHIVGLNIHKPYEIKPSTLMYLVQPCIFQYIQCTMYTLLNTFCS